jgi:hypothetical protein
MIDFDDSSSCLRKYDVETLMQYLLWTLLIGGNWNDELLRSSQSRRFATPRHEPIKTIAMTG